MKRDSQTLKELNSALKYLSLGLSVIPVARANKTPLVKWSEYQKRLPTTEEVCSWWRRFPDACVGIVTGRVSKIVVVDFDSEEAIKFAQEKGILNTPLVKTARGIHAYYLYPEGKTVNNSVKILDMKIDIRADGGYVVAPPSVHPSGHIYRWVKDREIGALPFAPLPDVFLDNSKNTTTVELRPLYKGVPQGQRNDSLARLVGSWLNDNLSYQECLEMAILWNQQNTPPMELEEVKRTVKSIYNRHRKNRPSKVFASFEKNLMFKIPLFVYNNDLVHKAKVVRITDDDNSEVSIHPSIQYGLPGQFDEFVFLLISKIIAELPKPVKNPVGLGSLRKIAESLDLPTGGSIISKIKESLCRLVLTGINSKQIVYDNAKQKYIEGTFHVFDMVVFTGEKLPDGNVAEQTFVWVNPLILNNVNSAYSVLVDFNVYKSLPGGITRGLYRVITPLLNFKGQTVKINYSTLQKRLQFKQETTLSLVKKQLDHALNSLVAKGIIKGFNIYPIQDDFIVELAI